MPEDVATKRPWAAVTRVKDPTMSPPPTLRVSEIFSSVQGEGTHVGTPCHFLRLGNCNLRCSFCDTKYTWDWSTYDREAELTTMTVPEVAAKLAAARHVVVTGGEPLLQCEPLEDLLGRLEHGAFVEVETNGTLPPTRRLRERVNQWNVSPKLSNSGEPSERRLRPRALDAFRRLSNAWLKLVVDAPARLEEATALVREIAWPPERVMLMPQAETREELADREPWLARACAKRGHRYSPRLQVRLWGRRRGY